MKGYLNNLSQRTLNMGNRVEPRLPSLFEPQPERVAAYQEETTTETQQIASPPTRRGQTVVAHRARESRRYVPTASNSEEVEIEDAAIPVRVQNETEADVELPVTSLPLALDPVSPVTQPEQLETFETTETCSEFEPRMTQMKTDSRMNTDQKANPSSSVSSVSSVVQAPIEFEVHEENSDVEHLPTEKIESFQSVSISRANPAPSTWSYTREQRRRQQIAPIDPPEPSINVTIGRVEVRAVPSDNKTTAPRRSESPVMPLEEYLRKQRRGGER